MNFSEKLYELRNQKGMTQEEVAEELGVSRQAVSRWEIGTTIADASKVLLLSRLFKVTMEYLLDDTIEDDETNDSANVVDLVGERQAEYERKNEIFNLYVGKKWDVQLNGWNDGINGAYIVSRDENLLYYVIFEKKGAMIGALGIRYVEDMEECKAGKENKGIQSYINGTDNNFFTNKKANVYLNEKHIWDVLVGDKKEYLGTHIRSINQESLYIVQGGCNEIKIPIEEVTKIELCNR